MKIALYTRVSSTHQAQTQTIEEQLQRLHSYCQNQQWSEQDLVSFLDNGYSGASLKRPGLDRLRDAVARAEIDRILLTEPSRLARNYVHQSLLLEEFQGMGCQVIFLDHPMSQDPHDQLLLQIRGAVAEYERTLIAERMRRGRQQKLRAGTMSPCAHPPYGYRSDPDHPRNPQNWRLEETEAAHVAFLFDSYLQIGQSLSGVAKQLTRLGIKTPAGGKIWHPSSLRQLLTNPTYTGTLYANREHVTVARQRRSPLQPVGHRESSVPLPSTDWIEVCQVPMIVSQERFEQVQAKLRENASLASRNNTAHPYLLKSLVSCGLCRGACVGVTRGTHSYYLCHGKWHPIHTHQEERCRARYIPVGQLDELVWQDLCHLLSEPANLAQALQRAQGGDWLPQQRQAQREQHRKAFATLTAQMERLTEAYLAGIFQMEEYRRRRQELEQRLIALDQQHRLVEAQIHQQMEISGMCEALTAFCQRVQTGLAEATFEQKRQLVELLIDRVIVTMDEVEIRYVIPTSPRSEHIRFCHLHTDYFHPNLVSLHMHQIELTGFNDALMNVVAVPARTIPPIRHGSFIQSTGMHNRLDRTAIGKKRHHDHDHLQWLAQPFEHRSLSGAKGVFADLAPITLPFAIVDRNVALPHLASCATRQVRAK
jgi:site-specific DNA recombinase